MSPRGKDPIPIALPNEVSLLQPAGRLGRMSSPRPGPQHTPESGARLLVNLLRNRVAVVSSPTQYLGTERMDDPVLGDVHVVLQPGLHTTEVFDHGRGQKPRQSFICNRYRCSGRVAD